MLLSFQAYRVVTDSIEGYWWSSQLFMFAIVYTVFLNTKSRQISMSIPEICAYTWLAFSGAVSLSLALFIYRYNVTLHTETRRVEHHQMSGWSFAVLAICLWLSYTCIIFLYYSVDTAFKVYLLLFHLILILPSFLPSVHVKGYTTQASKGLVPFLYALLAVALTAQHFYFTHLALPNSDPKTFFNLFTAGFDHYSQCAVSLNAVFCFIICTIYLLQRSDISSTIILVVPFMLLTPCISLGAAFSLVMFYEEYNLEMETEAKED